MAPAKQATLYHNAQIKWREMNRTLVGNMPRLGQRKYDSIQTSQGLRECRRDCIRARHGSDPLPTAIGQGSTGTNRTRTKLCLSTCVCAAQKRNKRNNNDTRGAMQMRHPMRQ